MPASAGPLQWVFELLDKVSGPAKRMETQLQKVEAALHRNSDALERAKKGAGGFGGMLQSLELNSFVDLLGKAWGALKGIGEAFGKTVIGSLAFKESTLASFEMILGSKQAAGDLFKEAARIAKLTPFNTQDVVENYSQLLGAGYNPKETGVLFQALGDISALSDFDPQVFSGITQQLAEMKAMGQVQWRHVQAVLTHSGKAGVGAIQIGEQVSNMLGLNNAQAGAEMLKGGELTGEQFAYAFVEAVRKKGGQGQVGAILMRQSETLKGLWSNITSIPTDTIFAFADNLKGINVLKGAMKTIINLFDTATPVGKRFQETIEHISDSILQGVFGPFQGKGGEEFFQEKMESFLAWAQSVDWIGTFKDVGTTLKTIGEAAMYAAKGINLLGSAFGAGGKAIGWLANEVYNGPQATPEMYAAAALRNGRRAQEGLAQGLIDNMDIVNRAAGLTGDNAAGSTASALKIKSPSGVFEELGRYSAEGYAIGLSSGMPDVAASLADMSGAGPGAAGGASSSRGGTVNIHEGAFPIIINAGSGDVEDLARQLRPALLREVMGIFEGLGMEVGMEGAT